jgi:hypothetical protein
MRLVQHISAHLTILRATVKMYERHSSTNRFLFVSEKQCNLIENKPPARFT